MTVIANVATFPGRRETLLQTLGSIAAQVDVVNLVLNEYVFIPHEVTTSIASFRHAI